jgi:hypothetical protein
MTLKEFKGYGRHIVHDPSSGRTFYVEPILPNVHYRAVWGDVDPATKRLTGTYNGKSRGGVTEQESLITEANGFKNIRLVEGSPYSEIEKILQEA